jgi:hypothetical protein
MATNLDLSTYNPMLKELYGPQVIENLVYKDKPLFAMIKKNSEMEGKNMPIPIIFNAGAGAVGTFSDALADQFAPETEAFALTRKRKYRIAQVDNETIAASNGNAGAFMKAMKLSVDAAFRDIRNQIAGDLYRSGTGSRGQISGSVSTGVVTLSNPNDVVAFDVGMVLQATQTDGGTLEAGTGYVIAVNRQSGTVTVSATAQGGAAGTPSGWSSGDYLVQKGDLNACLSGLPAWLPSTAPTSSDNFYGVNRSVDSRLYGVYYNGASQSIIDALIDGTNAVNREGGRPDYCFMNYASYSELLKELGGKVQYISLPGPANITFKGVEIATSKGMLKVVPDMDCTAETAFLLQMDTWGLYSAKAAPHIVTEGDNLNWLRTNDADAVQMRLAAYLNVGCSAPGWNGRVALSA